MKIEILTMHRIPNYGSVLQTYALQQYLMNHGYEVEIMDYYPLRYTIYGMLKSLKKKLSNPLSVALARMIIFPSYIKRFHVFTTFVRENIHVSPMKYRTKRDILKCTPQADVYCVGSDQVWNSEWSGGLDDVFYLNFDCKCKKIAYASSIGREDIDIDEKERMHRYLSVFSGISVREGSSVSILKSIEIEAECVVDPTFLLEQGVWERFSSNKYRDVKYILVYNLNREKSVDKVAGIVKNILGIPLYYVGYSFHEFYKGDRHFTCPPVEDFLSLVKNASFIVGDSFHVSAFSIIFKKEFIAVSPGRYSCRIRDLLERFNLIERYIHSNDIGEDDIFHIVSKDIDYDKVSEKISYEIEHSKNILLRMTRQETR